MRWPNPSSLPGKVSYTIGPVPPQARCFSAPLVNSVQQFTAISDYVGQMAMPSFSRRESAAIRNLFPDAVGTRFPQRGSTLPGRLLQLGGFEGYAIQ